MDKLYPKPRDVNLYGEDICPNSYVFNYIVEVKLMIFYSCFLNTYKVLH